MVGGGQLARMTQQAAVDLDVELSVLTPSPEDPAAAAGARFIAGSPDELAALEVLAAQCDVVTFDHELVPADHLVHLERLGHLVRPGSAPLAVAQDKLHARRLLSGLGFPVPRHATVTDSRQAQELGAELGWPLVLKAPRGGYDGRGVWVLEGEEDVDRLLATAEGGMWLLEEHLELETE